MDQELFEHICKRADEYKESKTLLNELWQILKTNRARLSEVEFSFAAEHIGNYYEQVEDKENGKLFEQKTSSD